MGRSILASVGLNGTNRPEDVRIVQALLNLVPTVKGGPIQPLKIDGLAWNKTTAAIKKFQQECPEYASHLAAGDPQSVELRLLR
jgi:hypothetical protein